MNQSTYNSLKSFIWGIANDCLVDVYDVGDYRKIILPMFVIRRFDAVLEPKHEAVMKAKEQFTKPYVEDAWINEDSAVIGYELSFTKYFYKPAQLRNMSDIIADIRAIEQSTDGLLASIIGGEV